MNTTTFTATFTFPTDSIIGFATWLGYSSTIKQPVLNDDGSIKMYEDVQNPQSALDFVKGKATNHIQTFVTGWAEYLKKQAIKEQVDALTSQLSPQLDEQIIKPVKDAIQVTYGN